MVSSDTVVQSTTILLRDKLLSNITDPLSGQRASNEKFVMTASPERPVKYPVIIVEIEDFEDFPAGIGTEQRRLVVLFSVDIWARTVVERDLLTDRVRAYLKSYQIDSSDIISEDLFGFKINSAVNVDEEGLNSPHRKIVRGSYQFIG